MGSLPEFTPTFREYKPQDVLLEGKKWLEQDVIIRDKHGVPRAVMQPSAKRSGYFCGDWESFKFYRQLAAAAGATILGVPRGVLPKLPLEIREALTIPAPYKVYRFGNVKSPRIQAAGGWMSSMLIEDEGVIICEPTSTFRDNKEIWTMMLYLLAWMKLPGLPLQAKKWFWKDSVSLEVPPSGSAADMWDGVPAYKDVPKDAFYSILGDKEQPTDLFLASGWAISALTHLIDQAGVGDTEEHGAF
jgi:hypothetical protein